MEPIFVSSTRNSKKLHFQGYIYTLHRRDLEGNVTWRCEDRACHGSIKSHPNNIVIEGSLKEHGHAPVPNISHKQQVAARITNEAARHVGPSGLLVRSILEETHESIRPLISVSAAKQAINRHRRGVAPQDPPSLDELNLNDPIWQPLLYVDEENFLFFDNNEDHATQGRIIIFITVSNLRHLSESQNWYADGHFKRTPCIFPQPAGQIYSIHGNVLGEIFPLVYCLLNRKTEECYTRVLNEIILMSGRSNLVLQPEEIMLDFETASITAFQNTFPNAAVKCCLFHLSQSVWRKLQNLGLQVAYVENDILRQKVHELISCASAPQGDVQRVFEHWSQNLMPELEPLAEYFCETYVIGRNVRGRQVPRFPIALWCVHDQVINNLPRANCHMEGWHNKLGYYVQNHPAMHMFLKEIKKEQIMAKARIEQLVAGGQVSRKKRKYAVNDAAIRTIVIGYNDRNIDRFLRGIAYHINLKR